MGLLVRTGLHILYSCSSRCDMKHLRTKVKVYVGQVTHLVYCHLANQDSYELKDVPNQPHKCHQHNCGYDVMTMSS